MNSYEAGIWNRHLNLQTKKKTIVRYNCYEWFIKTNKFIFMPFRWYIKKCWQLNSEYLLCLWKFQARLVGFNNTTTLSNFSLLTRDPSVVPELGSTLMELVKNYVALTQNGTIPEFSYYFQGTSSSEPVLLK